ncbi:DOUBLE-STRAND BREAK FORMATION-like protein [Drosera capensis]
MRQSHSVSHQCLRVTHEEWMTFAEHAFSNCFYSISAKAFENAVSCLQMNGISTRNDLIMSTDCVGAAENINKLKNEAIKLSASHPVQVQTAEYLKCKTVGSLKQTSLCKQGLGSASSSFRNGLKRRNEACLQHFENCRKLTVHRIKFLETSCARSFTVIKIMLAADVIESSACTPLNGKERNN